MSQPSPVTQLSDASLQVQVRIEARNLEKAKVAMPGSQDADHEKLAEPNGASARERIHRGDTKGQVTKDRGGNGCDEVKPHGSPSFDAMMSQAEHSNRQPDSDCVTAIAYRPSSLDGRVLPGPNGNVQKGFGPLIKSTLTDSTEKAFAVDVALPDEDQLNGSVVYIGMMLPQVGTGTATDPSAQSIDINLRSVPNGAVFSSTDFWSASSTASVPAGVEQNKPGNDSRPFRDLGIDHGDVNAVPRSQYGPHEALSDSKLQQATKSFGSDYSQEASQVTIDDTKIVLESRETHRAIGMLSGAVSAAFWRLADLAAVQRQASQSIAGAAVDLETNSLDDRLGEAGKLPEVEQRSDKQRSVRCHGTADGGLGPKDERGEAIQQKKFQPQSDYAIKASAQDGTHGPVTSLGHGSAPALQVGKETLTQLTQMLSTHEARRDDRQNAMIGGQMVRILELTLEPRDLGAVRVRLNLKDSVLSVEMTASKVSTAQLLERDCETLGRNLTEAGYDVAGVSIAIAPQDANNGKGPPLATTVEHGSSIAPGRPHEESSFGSAGRKDDQHLPKHSGGRDGNGEPVNSPERAVVPIPGKGQALYV